MRTRRLNRWLSRLYDQHLRAHNLSAARFNILVAVGAVGGLRQRDLVTHLALEKSAVSRTVHRMLDDELLESDDVGLLHITAAGAAVLEACQDDWQAAQDQATAALDGALVAALTAIAPTQAP